MMLQSGMSKAMQDEFMRRLTHDVIETGAIETQLALKLGECVWPSNPPMTGRRGDQVRLSNRPSLDRDVDYDPIGCSPAALIANRR